MSRLLSVLFLLTSVSIGIIAISDKGADVRADSKPNDADWKGATRPPDELSPQGKRLFAIAEDTSLNFQSRSNAVDEIGKLKERTSVPRLLRLLPGHYDALTFRCLVALEEIGDPRAIPALERMQKEAQEKQIDIPGKINTALDRALETCRANRQRGEKGRKDK
jgi:hypothetical protein